MEKWHSSQTITMDWRHSGLVFSLHTAKASKTTSQTNTPSRKQEKRSARTPATTAVMPLVPRAPWPSWLPDPSRRKGKSVSPSTFEEATSIPPTTREVDVQPRLPRSQTSKRSSSCGALQHAQPGSPHKETREENLPTVLVDLRLSVSVESQSRDHVSKPTPQAYCIDERQDLKCISCFVEKPTP
ncbi:hypothetical protein H4582DRAFT_460847 [Lactarius indigo]|nr:hypothetical protein H4582DRAFT_460847 [Lactarius indigo]